MNINRTPPYETFAEYDLDNSTAYTVKISDFDSNDVVYEDQITSTSTGIVSIPWSGVYGATDIPFDFSKYDETYSLEIFDGTDAVVEDTLTVERPYTDVTPLVTATYTLAQAQADERIARAIIDSITGGFYFKTKWYETTGDGTDYIPIWDRVYKILQAYENAELVYDATQDPTYIKEWNYLITKDKTAITKDPTYPIDAINRSEGNPNPTFIAISDSIGLFETDDSANNFTFKAGVFFGEGWDYLFKLETGWKVVPSDIKDAANLLIADLSCGKLDYHKRYITSYSTDQFRIQMDKMALTGSGNIVVDKILEKYNLSPVGNPRML